LPNGPVKNHVFDVVFNALDGDLSGANKQLQYHNYYLGKDKKRWKGNVPLYEEIRYQNIYQGVDLVLKSGPQNLKYDLIISPGANPEQISWDYLGTNGLHLENGQLVIETSLGPLIEMAPIAWQMVNGIKENIEVSFVLEESTIGFLLGEYNRNLELIIDPNYIFSSYTGSTADNFGYTATFDESGNTYGGGIVFTGGYPTTIGAFDTTFNGGVIDVSITKFSANGTQNLYSTFLGGSQPDQPHSMVVDANSDLIILGITGSANFPVTPTAFDTTFNGGPNVNVSFMPFAQGVDLFIAKLSSNGASLLASTFVGGSGTDGANLAIVRNYGDQARGEVIASSAGEILFASSSNSTDFPSGTNSYQDSLQGGQDAVLGRFNSNLSILNWSTYLGGTNNDAGFSLKLNSTENTVYAAGGTLSNNFPVSTQAYKPVFGGQTDGWIASFNKSNGAYITSTFNGTSAYDQNFFVALDEDDDVYVYGQTKGTYPTTPGLWGIPGSAQFIHKFSPNLQLSKKSMVFGDGSTATIDISPTALMVDLCKSVYISGWGGNVNQEGNTNGLPYTNDAQDSTTDGSDFYFLVLDGSWAFPEYASFFGGPGAEHVDGGTSRFSPQGVIHQAVCAGCGGQSTFPAFPSNVWSTTNNSFNCNLAVLKVDFELQEAQVNVALRPDSICLNNKLTFRDSSRNVDVMYWDFGDGTSYVGRKPNKYFTNAGSYTITIIGVDTLCNTADTAVLALFVFESFAKAMFTAVYDTCDLPFNVVLNNQSSGSGVYWWNFGDGTTSTQISPAKTYGKAGLYTITLTAKDSVCDNWDTTSVQVFFHQSGGIVDFEMRYDECVDWTELKVLPSNANNYQVFLWDFGDGGTSSSKFPEHKYTQPGSYTIQLQAIDTICKLTYTVVKSLEVIEYNAIGEIFPNVFTPNNDGVNDTWQIVNELSTDQFVDFKVEVYNRWGSLILTNYDPAYQWNGNYLENDLVDGVYFWLVWYTDICGNKSERHGEVHIIR